MDTQAFTPDQVEESDFRQVANPTNLVVFPENVTRGEIITHLSKTIPTTPDFGNLPLFYLRSDMLDMQRALQFGSLSQDEVDCAAEPLNFTDGYPTFSMGSPFWTQCPHEPYAAFALFKAFLDLGETEGIRLLDSLSSQQSVDLQLIRNHYGEFYWGPRARAYDLFLVAANQKKREARRRRIEDQHFTAAASIFDDILARINEEPDLIKNMPANELFNLFEQMVKVQRMSVGLGSTGNTGGEQITAGESAEVIFRKLTKNVGLSEQGSEAVGSRVAALMGDAESAMQVQELIIRTTSAGNAFPNG